jgi:hypothetical protein
MFGTFLHFFVFLHNKTAGARGEVRLWAEGTQGWAEGHQEGEIDMLKKFVVRTSCR